MVPAGLDLEFLPRQAQVLGECSSLAAGRVNRAERFIIRAPYYGLSAISRHLRGAEPVSMQVCQLPVSGRKVRDGLIAQIDVIYPGSSLAVALFMILGLLVLILWQGAVTFWPGPA